MINNNNDIFGWILNTINQELKLFFSGETGFRRNLI